MPFRLVCGSQCWEMTITEKIHLWRCVFKEKRNPSRSIFHEPQLLKLNIGINEVEKENQY